jgi:hypothetical protein
MMRWESLKHFENDTPAVSDKNASLVLIRRHVVLQNILLVSKYVVATGLEGGGVVY